LIQIKGRRVFPPGGGSETSIGRQGPNATQNAAATRAENQTSESQNNKSSRLMVEFCQKMSVELRMR